MAAREIENAIRALGPWGPAAHVALFTNYALGLTRIPVVSCMLTSLICGMATKLWTGVTGTVG